MHIFVGKFPVRKCITNVCWTIKKGPNALRRNTSRLDPILSQWSDQVWELMPKGPHKIFGDRKSYIRGLKMSSIRFFKELDPILFSTSKPFRHKISNIYLGICNTLYHIKGLVVACSTVHTAFNSMQYKLLKCYCCISVFIILSFQNYYYTFKL